MDPKKTQDEIEKTYKILKEGEKIIKLSENYKNITIIVGNTGAGKSTFLQWLVGNNEKLKSVDKSGFSKRDPEQGQYTIEDGDDQISSGFTSKTIFPEQIIDEKNNVAYYDCSGFNDTRSASHDIATTYFIRKLTDHAEKIKLILVTSYSSVSRDGDRTDFKRLMRHATELIKNIDKFHASIALVVTKVGYPTITSCEIINDIANFLGECERDLNNELTRSDISDENKTLNRKIIPLFKIILSQSDEKFTKIGIFRKPNKSGSLSTIDILNDCKISIEEMLTENLIFTPKSNDDFGHTISDNSHNIIKSLSDRMSESLRVNAEKIVCELQMFQNVIINELIILTNAFADSKEYENVSLDEISFYFDEFTKAKNVVSCLLLEAKSDDIEIIIRGISDSIVFLKINSCSEILKELSNLGEYLTFFQTVSDINLDMNIIADLFKSLQEKITASEKHVESNMKNAVARINSGIDDAIECVSDHIKKNYMMKVEQLEIEDLLDDLKNACQILTSLRDKVSLSHNHLDALEHLKIYCCELSTLDSNIEKYFSKISKLGESFVFCQKLNSNISFNASNLANAMNELLDYIFKMEKWYTFLNSVYHSLAEYEIQKKIINNFFVDIATTENIGKLQKMEVNENNFKEFLKIIKNLGLTYNSPEDLELDDIKLRSLNQLIQLTLNYAVEPNISKQGDLVIRGNFIKFSDFINQDGKLKFPSENNDRLSSVKVFASRVVYIDVDFLGIGCEINFNIIAPICMIIESRKIVLDGIRGPDHNPLKATAGNHGYPGLPGGRAGNFFCAGEKFDNLKSLKITVNGGHGGNGQNGGDGLSGAHGSDGHTTGNAISNHWTGIFSVNVYEGAPGKAGSNGGDGGIGGRGGSVGVVRFLNLGETNDVPVVEKSTSMGSSGKGGKGGKGGKKGDKFKIEKLFGLIPLSQNHTSMDEWAKTGLNGSDKGNSQGVKEPEHPLKYQAHTELLQDYKKCMEQKLKNSFNKEKLARFIDNCEKAKVGVLIF